MITKQEIFTFLKDAGIKPDDIVTIHCSLRAIGKIENGADGLIDAFCEYLHDGLFIVPTHTWNKVWKELPHYTGNQLTYNSPNEVYATGGTNETIHR